MANENNSDSDSNSESNSYSISDNDSNNGNDSIRCPCGSEDTLPQSKFGMEDWIGCDNCEVWQHSLCVGLIEELKQDMPDKYFCEECKPNLHKRFHFGSGSNDNRDDIAKERRDMQAMPRTRDEDRIRQKTKWLITEIDAIAQGHPQAVTAEWIKLNGMQADFEAAAAKKRKDSYQPLPSWLGDDFDHMVRLSIRIVLWNAPLSALESFRARLVKVWFGDAEAVAAELWSLRSWLTAEFMRKMKTEIEDLGIANVNLVRKYFNMK